MPWVSKRLKGSLEFSRPRSRKILCMKRAKIQVPTEASNETIENTALNQENVQRHIADKKIKKVIIVPKKLVNIVL